MRAKSFYPCGKFEPRASMSLSLNQERVELIHEMEQRFECREAEYFQGLLGHPDRVIRIRALSVLEALAPKQAVPAIGHVLLNDADPIVRHEAAFVLGQMGYKAGVEYLEHAVLNDSSPIVRHEAAVGLGVVGSQSSVGILNKVFSEDPDEGVRFSAEIALTNLDYLKKYGGGSDFSKKTGG
jgi:HEAT repeat protein